MNDRRSIPPRLVRNASARPRRRRRATGILFVGAAWVLTIAGAVVVLRGGPATDPMVTGAYAGGAPALAPRAMPVCGGGRRVNCVVDGDTVWLDGVKIRIANIDAPEVRGRCSAESSRAGDATRRLSALLQGREIGVAAEGTDRYGRTLARLSTLSGDVGDLLVRERLAVRWRGRKEPAQTWCGRA